MYSVKEIFYYLKNCLPLIILGKLRHNLIRVHWGRGLNNFGDCLSPYLLRHYGLTPVYVQQKKAEIILAGSILQWIPKDFSGYIVGTGGDDIKYEFPNAKILAVRGYKTLSNIKNNKDIILGDPGLLMPYVFKFKNTKEYELGIVPHFVDENSEIIVKWKNRLKNKALFINVLRDPKDVILDILRCKCIVSSSLHGLIIADAYHIPNIRFINRKTMPTYFYDYKFDDYYSSLNMECHSFEATGNESLNDLLTKVDLKPYYRIEELKENLNKLMIEVSNKFKNENTSNFIR